ncbi:hypothetical protein ACQPZJ_36910 [Actinoplanes sp. CA-054009]
MYQLAAVVAEAGVLRDGVARLEQGVVAILRCGLAMAPVSGALFEELTGSSHGDPFDERMPPEFDRALAEWSASGPVAWLQADFFGGDGHQAATVWRAGETAWGPVFDDRFEGPREQWPINAALARLGLRPSGRPYSWDPARTMDLFDEVGLGFERDVDAWVAYARAGLTPAHIEAQASDRELAHISPDLDGHTIMKLLNIPPGPLVGAATQHLRRLRRDRGPLSREAAETALRAWATEQGID